METTGFESNRVIGTGTILDTARLRALIGYNCGISPMSIHAYIIGEHGDSELAVWSSAMIGGVPITNFCEDCPFEQKCNLQLEEIFEEVKNSAYKIIEKKGSDQLWYSFCYRCTCRSYNKKMKEEYSLHQY